MEIRIIGWMVYLLLKSDTRLNWEKRESLERKEFRKLL
jgi:hypothetical protein